MNRVGGEEKYLQRFISVLVPSNMYQQHMPGDDSEGLFWRTWRQSS